MLWFSKCGLQTSITWKFLRNTDFQTPPHYSWIWPSTSPPRPPWWLSGKEFTCQYRTGGFHPWSGKIPHATEQLSLCTATTEPVFVSLGAAATEAHALEPRALQRKKPPWWEACVPLESSPSSPRLQPMQQWRPSPDKYTKTKTSPPGDSDTSVN